MSKEFVSIAELPSYGDVNYEMILNDQVPLTWDIPLPAHVDPEKMEVNISRLRNIQRVGKFCTSAVVEYFGEKDETVDSISGVNFDGTAVSSKSVIRRKADMSQGAYRDLIDYGSTWNKVMGQPIFKNALNRESIVQSVMDNRNDSVPDVKLWAQSLDSAYRDSLRKSAKGHLIDRSSGFRRLLDVMMVTSVGVNVPLSMAYQTPPLLLFIVGGSTIVTKEIILQRIRANFGSESAKRARTDYRSLLFNTDMQPERYLALSALTRQPGLIRSRS